MKFIEILLQFFRELVRKALEDAEIKPAPAPIPEPAPQPAPVPVPEPKPDIKPAPVHVSRIDAWCEAIKIMEGAKPSLNNPGNIKYIGQKTAIGKDYRGFAIFPTYEAGYTALRTLLVNACTGKSKVYYPDMTLYQFYAKYAPSDDGNNPNHYAEFVAKRLGVSPSIKIKELL